MDDILKSISAVVVGTVSGIIALFAYLHGKNREKNDFLINIIKMLDDNADRNARRRWFNTYGLKDDRDREICLDYMNALTEVKKRTNNED